MEPFEEFQARLYREQAHARQLARNAADGVRAEQRSAQKRVNRGRRAALRSAKQKAKDCSVVDGIRFIAADPCAYCNATNPTTHDHIDPFSRGGSHDLSNLVRCCWRCNKAKGVQSLLRFLALRAGEETPTDRDSTATLATAGDIE